MKNPDNKLALIGREFEKDKKKGEGYIIKDEDPLLINFLNKWHSFVVAKSGSGKTYLAGVLIEAIIEKARNSGVIIIDPAGNYRTLLCPNTGQEVNLWNEQLIHPDVEPHGLNLEIYVPKGIKKQLKGKEFAINIDQLSEHMFCSLFDATESDPQVRLLKKCKGYLNEHNPGYNLGDLEEFVADHYERYHFKETTMEALLCKLDMLEDLGFFADQFLDLSDLVQEGKAVLIDLCGSPKYTQEIIVNFLAEQLVEKRRDICEVVNNAEMNKTFADYDDYIPAVHLIIDESHRYLKKSWALKEYIKEGRNYGCILHAISQSVDLSDDLYENITHLFVGQLTFAKTISEVRGMIPVQRDLAPFRESVQSLDRGSFIYYNIAEKTEKKIRVRPRATLHLSTTEIRDERQFLRINQEKTLIHEEKIDGAFFNALHLDPDFIEMNDDLIVDDNIDTKVVVCHKMPLNLVPEDFLYKLLNVKDRTEAMEALRKVRHNVYDTMECAILRLRSVG